VRGGISYTLSHPNYQVKHFVENLHNLTLLASTRNYECFGFILYFVHPGQKYLRSMIPRIDGLDLASKPSHVTVAFLRVGKQVKHMLSLYEDEVDRLL